MTSRISHVFFDATDTLLRLQRPVGETYARIARRHGAEVSVAALTHAFSRTAGAMTQDIAPGRSDKRILQSERQWWYDIARSSFDGLATFADFDTVFEELFATYRETAAWELLPHARETLAQLQAMGIACSILSDMDSRLFPVLHSFGIEQFLENVFLSFRTGHCKPNPLAFTHACDASHVLPMDAVHIGDSWKKDVLGARSAGMQAIWYRPQGADEAHAPWIADLAELPQWLQSGWPEPRP